MRLNKRQSNRCRRHCRYLACLVVLLPGFPAYASEATVEPDDDEATIVDPSTAAVEARSDQSVEDQEEFVESVPAHDNPVPLADAVMTAEGRAAPLLLLNTAIMPGSAHTAGVVSNRIVRRRAGFHARSRCQRHDCRVRRCA